MGKHLHELLGWPGPMTYRQFLAWNEWQQIDNEIPNKADCYIMQLTQYLDGVLHMFDKAWKGRLLREYALSFGNGEKYEAPEKRPGKVPYAEEEWWPHPLTKEEVESGLKSIRLARHRL